MILKRCLLLQITFILIIRVRFCDMVKYSHDFEKYLQVCDAKSNNIDMENCYTSNLLNNMDDEHFDAAVKYLIDEKNVDAYIRDETGETLLHKAASHNRLDLVKYLIEEKQIDVNIKDDNGMTPMHKAAQAGEFSVTNYLIEKGAEVNTKDNHGTTAAEWAVYWIENMLGRKHASSSM